jgi:hypothetical protein
MTRSAVCELAHRRVFISLFGPPVRSVGRSIVELQMTVARRATAPTGPDRPGAVPANCPVEGDDRMRRGKSRLYIAVTGARHQRLITYRCAARHLPRGRQVGVPS